VGSVVATGGNAIDIGTAGVEVVLRNLVIGPLRAQAASEASTDRRGGAHGRGLPARQPAGRGGLRGRCREPAAHQHDDSRQWQRGSVGRRRCAGRHHAGR
jgi:hypothetical protein